MLRTQGPQITHPAVPLDRNTRRFQCRKHSRPISTAAHLALFLVGLHHTRISLRRLELGNLPVAAVVRPQPAILLLKELIQHKLQRRDLVSVTAQQPFRQPIEVAAVQRRLTVVVHIESVTVNGTLQP